VGRPLAILFPIVGSLKDSVLIHNNHEYAMPRHGIARHATFTTTDVTDSTVTMELRSSDTTREVFPWDFCLSVSYTLSARAVNIEYRVQSAGNDAMRFTIGAHPALSLPLNQSSIDQYSVHFNNDNELTRFRLFENGLLAATGEPYALNNNQVALSTSIFDDDALVFKDIRSTCLTLCRQGIERVRVHTGGAPHLGLWAKPGAAFVCIEPWFGYSDAEDATGLWTDKPALLTLQKGETFTHRWAIEIAD
jgi:galactose mutarotase-like enzyme